MVFRCCSYFPPLPACCNIRQFPFLVVVVVSLSYFYTLIRLLLCGFLSDSKDQKVMMNDSELAVVGGGEIPLPHSFFSNDNKRIYEWWCACF
jgi:hypothetical protein